jgi:hypothetical protein
MWVRYDGEGRPPVTDGPFAETKDLIAGFMIIAVDSPERAIELAGELSAAPGKDGKPIQAAMDHPEVAGLLALMLLHSARHRRTRAGWDTAAIAEGVQTLQTALSRDRLGRMPGAGRHRRAARPTPAAPRSASALPERDHLTREAARLDAGR